MLKLKEIKKDVQISGIQPDEIVRIVQVEPLPHQISAVYESMLPRHPLRFVLADDPGAGKTITADLLIRELLMRADAKRILIVALLMIPRCREILHQPGQHHRRKRLKHIFMEASTWTR